MKKKSTISENYLEKVPIINPLIKWKKDEHEKVTLEIENTGFFNKIAQKFFNKPKITFVHLDEIGSFVWPLIDSETDILKLGELVESEFGDKSKPLYERLAKFFQILESYGFISFK